MEDSNRYDEAQKKELTSVVRKWAREHRPDLRVGVRGKLSAEAWAAYDTSTVEVGE